MKKLSIAVAVAGAFAATGAGAAVLGEFDQGCLVPAAIHGSGADTVVGITARLGTTAGGAVHWTFFDVNSNHISDGHLTVTNNDLASFSLKDNAGALTTGVQGYLVFTAENTVGTHGMATSQEAITCNSFYVTANDAAFIPSPSLTQADYSGAAQGNLSTLGPTSVISLVSGSGFTWTVLSGGPNISSADPATGIHMRYWIDGATAGRDTSIVIWTADSVAVSSIGATTVNMYNDNQVAQSVTMALPNMELNLYNPETQVGRPANFLDGFIDLTFASLGAVRNTGIFVYSVVSDTAFGATQTLMGASY